MTHTQKATKLKIAIIALVLLVAGNAAFAQGGHLVKISATLTTSIGGGANLDHNSSLTLVLHPTTSGVRAAQAIANGPLDEGTATSFDFQILANDLTKLQIGSDYSVDAIITAVGHDHYAGNLQLTFYFDDGTNSGWAFDFHVGTYKEGNQMGAPVKFL